MFRRIFPSQFDNAYRGNRLAIWLFVPILFLRFMMGFNSVFFTRFVAASADGLDLGGYGAQGTGVVLSMYALLGLALMLLSLIGLVALIRYRAMIPFLYLVLLVQQGASWAIDLAYPIARSGAPTTHTASAFVLGALALTAIGFVLSLQASRSSAEAAR